MAVKIKKATVIIIPNGTVSESYMEWLGFTLDCCDGHEMHYIHKRVLNQEEKRAFVDKIARKAFSFYNIPVEE